MHHKTYLKQDWNAYIKFLKGLAKLTNYYDFSGLNEITTNNFNYYETSHYRPFIGDLMIKRLFSDRIENFGVLITAENINEVIKLKNKELKEFIN